MEDEYRAIQQRLNALIPAPFAVENFENSTILSYRSQTDGSAVLMSIHLSRYSGENIPTTYLLQIFSLFGEGIGGAIAGNETWANQGWYETSERIIEMFHSSIEASGVLQIYRDLRVAGEVFTKDAASGMIEETKADPDQRLLRDVRFAPSKATS